MSWEMPWTVFDSFSNVGGNLKDGYQFGDITKGWFGWNDNRSTAASAKKVQSSYDSDGPLNFEDYSGLDYSLGSRLKNLFTGKLTSAEKSYENYLASWEGEKNKRYTDEANKKTWAREDNAIQRLMADYKAAGLNPYLILNGGNLGGVNVSSAKQAEYKRRSQVDDNKLTSTAVKVLMLVLLKKML